MRAGGRLARGEDFLDRVGITGRIVLLVFLLEPARILAGVTRAAAMRPGRAFRRRDRCGIVGHSSLQALVSDIAKTRCTNVSPDASKGSEYPTRCLILEQASGGLMAGRPPPPPKQAVSSPPRARHTPPP